MFGKSLRSWIMHQTMATYSFGKVYHNNGKFRRMSLAYAIFKRSHTPIRSTVKYTEKSVFYHVATCVNVRWSSCRLASRKCVRTDRCFIIISAKSQHQFGLQSERNVRWTRNGLINVTSLIVAKRWSAASEKFQEKRGSAEFQAAVRVKWKFKVRNHVETKEIAIL